MGQQVNRSSKVKSPSESDCSHNIVVNYYREAGLVARIRPETR